MFSVYTTPDKFENASTACHIGSAFEENSNREITFFRPHENAMSTFSNFSGLKSVFVKLRFRDGLV